MQSVSKNKSDMEKIKVSIKTISGNADVFEVTALKGRLSLFSFFKGIETWNFNAHGIGRSWVKSDEFPLDYFKRLCQAICFISLGLTEFPEIELTSEAKKLLKIK